MKIMLPILFKVCLSKEISLSFATVLYFYQVILLDEQTKNIKYHLENLYCAYVQSLRKGLIVIVITRYCVIFQSVLPLSKCGGWTESSEAEPSSFPETNFTLQSFW